MAEAVRGDEYRLTDLRRLTPWNDLVVADPQLRSTLVGVVPGLGVLIALLIGVRDPDGWRLRAVLGKSS